MSNDRRDPDATPGLHDEFWGEQSEWAPQRRPAVEHQRVGATIGRWWSGLLGGDSVAERAHGVAGRASARNTLTNDMLDEHVAAFRDVATHDTNDVATHDRDDVAGAGSNDSVEPIEDDIEALGDDWTFERDSRPSRTRGIDPLLARFGGLAIIVTLAAPLVVGFASSGSGAAEAESALATMSAPPAESPAPSPAASDVAVTDPSVTAGSQVGPTAVESTVGAVPAEGGRAESAAITPTTTAGASPDTASLEAASEPATTAAVVATSQCGSEYELSAGDYWIRIAAAAGVSLAELLEVNDSTVDSVLVPGRSICLPVGAATPAPPATVTTTAATASPAPTSPTSTAAPSRPTATTATSVAPAPTTTVPARPAAVTASQAEAIIRDVWPDDLEERALEIAWRESNYQSNVSNWCCYGLFQIHWSAHRSWLATIGVTSATQLYDPFVNASAAYTLYQRSGGFGPWGG